MGTLIGHTYVESFSASGLVLVGPSKLFSAEITLPDTWKSNSLPDTPWSNPPTFVIPRFTYEPRFPILHLEASDLESPKKVGEMANSHLSSWPTANVDFKVMPSSKAEPYNERDIVKEMKSWLDEAGL